MTIKKRFSKSKSGEDTYYIPKTCVPGTVGDIIARFMDEYDMTKSDAIRHVIDNGIQYMAIYGDGVGENK